MFDASENRDPFVGKLRVSITADGYMFFAGGIDLDYAAAGDTVKDAQKRFLNGLSLTVRAWKDQGLDLAKMVKPGPSELTNEWTSETDDSTYEIVSLGARDGESRMWADLRLLPFTGIAFKYESEWERK
jgi:hypothetical protein